MEQVSLKGMLLNPKDGPLYVIIDDDSHILAALARHLDLEDVNYRTFQDPLEAMNFISKNKIAHVFTDYHMKGYGMTGRWIKEICNQYNIKCSYVSGDDDVADISKMAFMLDCCAYMRL